MNPDVMEKNFQNKTRDHQAFVRKAHIVPVCIW